MRKDFPVIRILIVFLFGLVLFRVSNVHGIEPVSPEERRLIESLFEEKGKQIQFSDSSKYDRERAIAYDIMNMAESEKDNPGSDKARISIALEDIDDDGNNEILAYIEHIDWCGSRGCTFIVLKKDKDGDWKKFLDMIADPPIIMMCTNWHGYHDIAFVEEGSDQQNSLRSQIIWRFDGEHYIAYAKRQTTINKESKKGRMVTYCFDHAYGRWEIIDDKEIGIK